MFEKIKNWIINAFAHTSEVKEFVFEEELPVKELDEPTEELITEEPKMEEEKPVTPKKPKRKYNRKKKSNENDKRN